MVRAKSRNLIDTNPGLIFSITTRKMILENMIEIGIHNGKTSYDFRKDCMWYLPKGSLRKKQLSPRK